MKKITLLVLLFYSGYCFCGNYHKTDYGVDATINSMNVRIQFYNSGIVRVVKYPSDKAITKESLSVIKTPEKTDLSIRAQGESVVLSSDKISVLLDLKTGKVTFSDKSNNQLLTEKDYGTQFTDFNDAGVPSFRVRQAFMLDEDEVIYGLGQQQTGLMNQRNQRLFLRNQNMHICIPIIHSVKGYAVFWDNYSPTVFTDNVWETSFDSELGDCSDYYFMYGGNADGTIAALRDLTGQAPMYPLWTLGFWQSRERYVSQDETVGVVKKYRELGVPLDGIIQDWQYWGPNSNWNSMSFDNPEFPNPKKMIDDIHRMNAHIMISVWASFGPDTEQYKIMNPKGMLYDFETWPPKNGVKPYDPFNPEARQIYWSYMKKNIFDLGMDAWWLDSTEPDHFDIKDSDFDIPTYLGSFRRVHNAFPLVSNMGVYENQRAVSSDKRVFLLTRSSFAGQQRYASHSWSGDVVTNWKVFRKQIAAGLNYTFCGIPYWGTDIGGFFAWEYGNDVNNKAYHEIHTRWHQFATFTPIMRSHNSSPVAVEIYQFGKKGDWAYDAIEKYIKLRYRILPYIYSTSWEVTSNAGSFMRHLSMDFPEDKRVHNIDDQFLFGRNLLVKAVTEPMYVRSSLPNHSDAREDFSTVKSTSVYLPAGTSWVDFWTGETIAGGREVNKATPIDIIPLYLRAGSILPWGPDVQYAEEKRWDNLEIRIYPGANGQFTLYEDENDNYNYEKGMYSTLLMEWNDKDRTLTIGERKGSFPGMLKNRKFRIVVVEPGKAVGDSPVVNFDRVVTYRGKKQTVKL